MKQTPITPEDIARSVWAVPPLALTADNALDDAANRALVGHIEAGGVSTLLYGGNANLYAAPQALFEDLMTALPEWAASTSWVIPSVGPDWGKLMDQATALKGMRYPAAMALPMTGPRDAAGTERSLRDFVQRAGMPLIVYIRQPGYLPPDRLGALIDEGVAVALKYAVESDDLTVDAYLASILRHVPGERMVSGIGEIAGVAHLSAFPLAGFTAGAVCIAPRRAATVLAALGAGDIDLARHLTTPIEALERLRQAHGPIAVIHEAVTLSGIAAMGPILPHLSALPAAVRPEVEDAARRLLEAETDLPGAVAA